MSSSYPAALDNLPADFEGTDQADVVDHAGMHNAERDAINALQAELGTDPSGAAATVKARLDAVDADGRWTDTRTPTDGTVSTAKLIDGAVTVVKLAGSYGAKTAAYTITTADSVIAADTTSGAFALTLPAASASTGKTLRIIKTGGANVLTISRAGSDTILPSNGTRTSVAFPSDCARGSLLLVSNGAAWEVLEGRATDETVGSREYQWSAAKAATSTTAAVGWGLVSYDSGWRDISGLLINGWTKSGDLLLRRVDMRINLWAGYLSASAATADVFATVPTGFRARSTNAVPVLSSGSTVQQLVYNGAGTLSSAARTATLYVDHSWLTDNALPTSLPGTAS